MKAHINGITVEGTPQEIMEYHRMQAEKSNKKPFNEVCRELGHSLGALIAVSHQLEQMNQRIKHNRMQRDVSRTGEGIKIYGGYTNQDRRPTH